MQLGYVIVYVKDVLGTAAFYEKAFGIKVRFIPESKLYAEMETGQTALAFVSESMMKESHPFHVNRPNEQAAGAQVSFVTDDVEGKFHHAVKAGAVAILKPMDKPWGQRVSLVRDNNGFVVEICSPVK